ARNSTATAVSSAGSVSVKMNDLGKAAREINQVIAVIVEISEQTKLLALNATIEAARAGESGKGFAVVANEVKELAKQTNQATVEIRTKIEAMQGSTDRMIEEIEKINHTIASIDTLTSSTAASAEEQTITTKDISHNIGSAASGLREVARHIEENAKVSESIVRDIFSVKLASVNVMSVIQQMGQSAKRLSLASDSLKSAMEGFELDSIVVRECDLSAEQKQLLTTKLREALQQHDLWKTRLLSAIQTGSSEFQAEKVRTKDGCAFGKFFYGLDKEFKDNLHAPKIEELHARFHVEAAQVLEIALQGRRIEALKRMDLESEFNRVSTDLARVIWDWMACLG
ncbi:MAG TPA: methyl-accepting chemotaxis protein, partial [Chroococcales cyanobacterium]